MTNIIQINYSLKTVQHNALAWIDVRSKELSKFYNISNPNIILLNSASVRDNKSIRIFNYNVYSKNFLNELQAGVAIAVRKKFHNIKFWMTLWTTI